MKTRLSEPERDYLGASEIGECERSLCFSFTKTPKDPGKDFPARILRIFERGHSGEELMQGWLEGAGFKFETHNNPINGQIGFKALDGAFGGHIDGMIIGGPDEIEYPCLWENKVLGAKGWRAIERHGLKKQYPEYCDQIQTYMPYLELTENPTMFTALNADTMDIYIEMIPFDPERAQQMSDKAVQIVQAVQEGDLLPRPYHSPDFFKCKWCEYSVRCWSLPY